MSVSGMARLVGSPEHRTHWSHLADAVRTGEAVPPKLYGMSAWDYIEQRPELAVDPLVAGYDWSQHQTIIDVGGGHGRLLAAIIAAKPGAEGVLYDLPQVVEGAQDGHPRLARRRGGGDPE
jgi:hypothetical protein